MMETTPLNTPPKSNEDAHMQTLHVLFHSTLIGAALLVASASHVALDVGRVRALFSQNAYLDYHTVGSRVVEPVYKDVVAKYKGGNPIVLDACIKPDGVGKWGEIVMPPQAQSSDVDIRILAVWILADYPDQ